ncbi:MAG: holo-[acyl-carrier-protein] synthase [Chloroflexi bacterium]|nr:holo-[acyl-carrier-protein] synthase [Chloroflexota bacterium]
MIYTGIDMIEINRIQSVLNQYEERFLNKIFTKNEQIYCKKRSKQLASRFAAKEAVMKLLGTGVRGIPWKSIEITRKRGAPPEILLHGNAIKRAKKMGITRIALSLSHSKKYAIASATGEAKENYWQPST